MYKKCEWNATNARQVRAPRWDYWSLLFRLMVGVHHDRQLDASHLLGPTVSCIPSFVCAPLLLPCRLVMNGNSRLSHHCHFRCSWCVLRTSVEWLMSAQHLRSTLASPVCQPVVSSSVTWLACVRFRTFGVVRYTVRITITEEENDETNNSNRDQSLLRYRSYVRFAKLTAYGVLDIAVDTR